MNESMDIVVSDSAAAGLQGVVAKSEDSASAIRIVVHGFG